jgi:ribonuclease R
MLYIALSVNCSEFLAAQWIAINFSFLFLKDCMSAPESMDSPPPLTERLLAHLRHPNYRPVKPKVIVKQLELSEDEARDLKRAIKKLVKRGDLAWGSKHLVQLASPNAIPTITTDHSKPKRHTSGEITGVFRRTASGNGFVRPAGTPREAERTLDIFIESRYSMDAASGDTVRVKLRKEPRRGRDNQAGQIVEVIERQNHRFVGTYFNSGGNNYVQIDGKIFAQPILVDDASATNAMPDDKVLIEMVRFPSNYETGEGVIVEVLGQRGQPGVDTLLIMREFNLPDEFREEILQAARAEADLFHPEVIEAPRQDLTQHTVITIDPIDARDFDDAISLTQDERGFWRLGVHIADVSHFVKAKGTLDREAYERATSVYLPDRVIPMLPEIISNNLASLQPDKIRYTQTCFIEFNAEGIVTHTEVCLSAIKSCRRFTYEEVDEFLADREPWREKLTPPVHRLLNDMHTLAMILRKRRMQRGSLELSMKEVKVVLDRASGQVVGAKTVVNTESHQIIEEFMLAANEAVASIIANKGWPFLRRIHANPDPRRLKQLTEFVTELGIETESLESRFELQRVLAAVHGKPEQHAVNYAMLRSLQQAVYSPREEGHYALASECYCHFTSPIRRYPDLTIHRLVRAMVTDTKLANDFAMLEVQGEHCSDRERRAEAAERELTKLKLLGFMSERIGQTMLAVITGVEDFGLFVQGLEIPAEGLLHTTALHDDYYDFDRTTHTLTGRSTGKTYRLGDKVEVVIARVDLDRRELDFQLKGNESPDLQSDAAKPRLPDISRPKRGPGRFAKGGPGGFNKGSRGGAKGSGGFGNRSDRRSKDKKPGKSGKPGKKRK